MNQRELLIETYPDCELLTADGFDEAIIGADDTTDPPRVIYSVRKIIHMLRDGAMTAIEAREFFDFNVKGSFMGESTTIWCEDELFEESK